MKIRKAEEKDIPRIMELLGQVLQIHAEIRPDVFIPGTTKYTVSELKELLEQEDKPSLPSLRQHRTIPALRLKHRSGGCGTASALPKCSIRHPVLSALLA